MMHEYGALASRRGLGLDTRALYGAPLAHGSRRPLGPKRRVQDEGANLDAQLGEFPCLGFEELPGTVLCAHGPLVGM